MLDLRELSDDMLLARPERLTMDHRHADGKFDQVRAWLMAAERERTPAGSGTGCECRSRHERLPTHFATVCAQLGVVASSSQRRSSVCRPFFISAWALRALSWRAAAHPARLPHSSL